MFLFKPLTGLFCLITFSVVLLPTVNQSSSAQNISPTDLNSPLDVQNPENKQDFIQQCVSNLKAQNNTPTAQAQSYCSCSADAVYDYLNQAGNNVSSEGDILEKVLQCRMKHIPPEK